MILNYIRFLRFSSKTNVQEKNVWRESSQKSAFWRSYDQMGLFSYVYAKWKRFENEWFGSRWIQNFCSTVIYRCSVTSSLSHSFRSGGLCFIYSKSLASFVCFIYKTKRNSSYDSLDTPSHLWKDYLFQRDPYTPNVWSFGFVVFLTFQTILNFTTIIIKCINFSWKFCWEWLCGKWSYLLLVFA